MKDLTDIPFRYSSSICFYFKIDEQFNIYYLHQMQDLLEKEVFDDLYNILEYELHI